MMRFIVIECFDDPKPIYRRLAESGRLIPKGVTYLDSWVDTTLQRCFQLMEAPSRKDLEEWVEAWADLGSFEIVEVFSSAEAQEAVDALP